MDIKSILVLEEENPNSINLILSGSFVKIYNRSYYLLTEVLGHKLKSSKKYIKSAGNRFVVSGGFPDYRVAVRYPQAIKTSWGYQIACESDTKAYTNWLLRQESTAQAVGSVQAVVAGSRAHLCAGESATKFFNEDGENLTNINLSLTPQQASYLQDWHKGDYPIEVDLGFIESLKTKLIASND